MSASNRTMTQVKLSGVHLCCEGCVNGVTSAVENIPGVEVQCDMEMGTVLVTAKNEGTAQQALDAIADAGFHGASNNSHLVMKTETDIPRGMVRTLWFIGVHNCCRLCSKAIQDAIHSVKGVTGDTIKPRKSNFSVLGEYSAAAVIQALNRAGFHVKVDHEALR